MRQNCSLTVWVTINKEESWAKTSMNHTLLSELQLGEQVDDKMWDEQGSHKTCLDRMILE